MPTSPVQQFDSKNADQFAAWNGAEGRRWTDDEPRYDLACSRFDRWLFDSARIADGETVLDIGCGCGLSTRQAARAAGSGRVLGIDLSEPMILRARERAREEGLENGRFDQGDAQVFAFEPRAFDVAISRFGCMFFGDPDAAFRNVANALKPRGRLALLTWRALADNEWVSALRNALAAGRTLPDRPPGAPGPFGMADAVAVTALLTGAGFGNVELRAVNEPVILGTSADDAFAYVRAMGMARALLDGLDETATTRALTELSSLLATRATKEGVHLSGGAWLVTAQRA